MIYEPKWKSLLANTTDPIFSPAQCQDIINMGHQQKTEDAKVGHKDKKDSEAMILKKESRPSVGFLSKMPEMYRMIERTMQQVNGNHFGYEGMTLTEPAQFTEYPKGGFYDWHMDADVNCQFEPPVRKISMTILLSPQSEFEGGDLEFMTEGNKPPQLLQGQAILFCSLLRHRVSKVKKGVRRSLVMWFGGPPFK